MAAGFGGEAAKVYENKGHLPEDVNIGIKISRVLTFLQQTGGAAPENLEELYRTMMSDVVPVAGESR